MHPSHIPFIRKSESTARTWSAYARPSCRLFGNHDCPRTALGDDCIEMAQKANCLQIFAAAVDVGDPFTFFAAVVAVQHRGHSIDAKAVDMKVLQPIKRAGNQETLHFAPTEIVDQSTPIEMKALAWIEMFVQRCPIEPRQPVGIGRKMRRHPVENDANIGAMQRVDKAPQARRWSKPGGWREQAKRLVTPRAAKRMFSDRQQLDMGEFPVDEIRQQSLDCEVPQRD